MLLALQFVNNIGYLEGGPKLESQVLHHHIRVQQQQGIAVNFMSSESLHMDSQ